MKKAPDRLRRRWPPSPFLAMPLAIVLASLAIYMIWRHEAGEQERVAEIRAMSREISSLEDEVKRIDRQLETALQSTLGQDAAPALEPATIALRLEALDLLGRSIDADGFPGMPALQRRGEWFSTLAQRRLEGRDRDRNDPAIVAISQEYSEVYQTLLGELGSLERSLGQVQDAYLSHSSRQWAWRLTGSIAALAVLLAFMIVGRGKMGGSQASSRPDRASLLRSELHSQKMEAVGRLAGGIAHDLNNYLAVITAHSELVRMGAEPEDELTSKMNKVISTSEKATALLRQLLNFSRQKPAMTDVVDLNQVVTDLDPMLRRLVGDHVSLELELSSDLDYVEVDPSQMEQVVVNLVVNAKEAMVSGGRIILSTHNTVGRLEGHSRTSALVVLSIADDGPGIPEEIRERIFEPYYSTKAGEGSSGLGLATVYGIANQNRGDVQLSRGLRSGARFDIRLPRTERTAALRNSTRGPARGASDQERLLLVEDNEDLRLATEEMLRRLGYGVRTAASGAEALSIFDDEPGEFDLVISDVVMAGIGGPELAAAIQERDPDLPVLLVSGYRDSTIFGRVQAADVEFLAKPFTAKALDGRIREMLDKG